MRIDRLTSKLQLALSDSQSLAVGLDHPAIEPAHLMQALLEQQGGSIKPLLLQVGFDINSLRQGLTRELDQLGKLQNPTGDIEIETTGLRPGEKLYEELLIGDDTQPTQHPRILRAREAFRPWSEFEHTLLVLDQALSAQDVPAARALLQTCVQGYQPAGDMVD